MWRDEGEIPMETAPPLILSSESKEFITCSSRKNTWEEVRSLGLVTSLGLDPRLLSYQMQELD